MQSIKKYVLFCFISTPLLSETAVHERCPVSWVQTVKNGTKCPEQTFHKAWQAEQQHDYKEAEKLHHHIVTHHSQSPSSIASRVRLGELWSYDNDVRRSADDVHAVLWPVTQYTHKPIGIHTHQLIGQAYARENRKAEAFISFINALSIAYYHDTLKDPHYALYHLLDLVQQPKYKQLLYETLNMSTYDANEQSAFIESIGEHGKKVHPQAASLLLAERYVDTADTQKALPLLQTVEQKYARRVYKKIFAQNNNQTKVQAAWWLAQHETNRFAQDFYLTFAARQDHSQAHTECMQRIDQEKQNNNYQRAAQLLLKMNKTSEAYALWKQRYQEASETDEKYEAAYHLSCLEKQTATAEIYLVAAAGKGHPVACEKAFYLSELLQDDEQRSRRLLRAAAQGGHHEAQTILGMLLKKEGKLKEAKQLFEKAMPFSAVAQLQHALIKENLDNAIKGLIPLAENERYELQAEAQCYLATCYREQSKTLKQRTDRLSLKLAEKKDALELKWLRSSVKLGCNESAVTLAARLYQISEKLARVNRQSKYARALKKEAHAVLQQALERNPETELAWLNLALLNKSDEKVKEAAHAFKEAFARGPERKQIIQALSVFMLENITTQPDIISDLADHMLETVPGQPIALYTKGIHALYNTRDTAQACMFLEKAADNNSAEALHTLACLYTKGEQVEQSISQAINYCERLRKLEPSHTENLAHLASLYEQSGQDKKALNVVNQAASLGSPEAAIKCALYAHTGYGNSYSLDHAYQLYNYAAQAFEQQNQHERARQAKSLAQIVSYQREDIFSTYAGNDEKIIAQFQQVKKALHNLIHITEKSFHLSGYTDEANLALAMQYIKVAEYYKDQQKKDISLKIACSYLEKIPDHILCATYNHATLLLERYISPRLGELSEVPYDQLDDETKKIALKLRDLYDGLLNFADLEPHNTFIMKSYTNYGVLLLRIFDEPERARTIFKQGADSGSISSMLSLATFMQQEEQTVEKKNQIRSLLDQALTVAHKTNNPSVIKQAEQRRNEIIISLNQQDNQETYANDGAAAATNQ